jgi:hypothetical protein
MCCASTKTGSRTVDINHHPQHGEAMKFTHADTRWRDQQPMVRVALSEGSLLTRERAEEVEHFLSGANTNRETVANLEGVRHTLLASERKGC